MHTRLVTALALGLLAPLAASGQGPKLKVKDTVLAPHWIYDDVPAAFARAKETGKPILVLFR